VNPAQAGRSYSNYGLAGAYAPAASLVRNFGTTVALTIGMGLIQQQLKLMKNDVSTYTNEEQLLLLGRLLSENSIEVVYEPIFRLPGQEVFGYEALARFPGNNSGVFSSIEALLAFAEETAMVFDLDLLCWKNALRLSSSRFQSDIGDKQKLFINISTGSLQGRSFSINELVKSTNQAGFKPEEIVVEVTERVRVSSLRIFRESIAHLRSHGFSVALDDLGAGYNSLSLVAKLRPEYLKLDSSIIRDIQMDTLRSSIAHAVLLIGNDSGAKVIAKGIETKEELKALCDLGIAFGQGRVFDLQGENEK